LLEATLFLLARELLDLGRTRLGECLLAPPGPILPDGAMVDCPGVMLGFLKYSEMAARCCLVPAPTSHMTRKNAIMAVTKSA